MGKLLSIYIIVILIEKGSEIVKTDLTQKSNVKEEEHPLFMNVLEKFDGEILR